MSNSYDELLEKITASTLTTENWDGILTFCDKINGDIDGCKLGLKSLKKRLNNRDPHVVMMAISVLDSCWANCGEKFRKEVSSGQFINELKALSTNSQRLVAEKMRITIKKWVDNECKKEQFLSLIVSLFKQLKEDGYSFEVDDPKKKTSVLNSKYANDPNYVSSAQEEEEIAKAIAASLADAEKQDKIKKTTSSLYPSTNKATTPNQNSSANSANERKVRALYDFEAAEGNELSFVAGDIITVTDESNAHWWTGRIGVQQGLFPSSFVTNDLEEASIPKQMEAKKEPEVVATINEAILSRCLNVLHECDPTGERPDPADLAQLEAASYAQGPLIDAQLASIDRQSNALAQIDIAIRDVLALYDDAIQKGGYQPYTAAPPTAAPIPPPQPYAYTNQPQAYQQPYYQPQAQQYQVASVATAAGAAQQPVPPQYYPTQPNAAQWNGAPTQQY
ncbi:unnamed protein product [Caenorhabditis bovis]|uniref:Signal transducing adapter molecule 1 n=1 Tax=Caenorhabditis bovis TaxID=2654633 RepID=A0A8S1FC19_9PELO|nr:unnamed protein product [Caenorhabditis bovis]